MTIKNITIEYARQKLGKKAQGMTDEEIAHILSNLRLLCSKTIDRIMERKR